MSPVRSVVAALRAPNDAPGAPWSANGSTDESVLGTKRAAPFARLGERGAINRALGDTAAT
jgi:hypothetical protein